MKLLAKFYAPQAGVITIDGLNIQQLDPIQLRQLISFQSQDNHIFEDSIINNLLLNNPLADKDAITKAVSDANVYDEIVALKNGFDTYLSRSLQEKLPSSFIKKLILARTYLKSANLYVLDEPTKNSRRKQYIRFYNQNQRATENGTLYFCNYY